MFYLVLAMAQENEGLTNNDEVSRPFIEPYTHSFVIKVWLEETPDETLYPIWRGHITHVASGQRQYVTDLNGFLAFMMPYLTKLGVKMSWLERLCLWLNRRQ